MHTDTQRNSEGYGGSRESANFEDISIRHVAGWTPIQIITKFSHQARSVTHLLHYTHTYFTTNNIEVYLPCGIGSTVCGRARWTTGQVSSLEKTKNVVVRTLLSKQNIVIHIRT